MDKGTSGTQKVVIVISIILGIFIVATIGYSLYQRAKIAEANLANKEALERETRFREDATGVSITGEAKNTSLFNYDRLLQQQLEENTAPTDEFGVSNETIFDEEPIVPIEEPEPEPVVAPKPAPNPNVYYDQDRPLTAEEIRRIRQLPVDESPTGYMQNALEEYTNGEYKAQYE